MSSIYNAWFSKSQEKICGGSATYRTITGEVVLVSEISKNQPEGDWDDYQLVGQVNLDDKKCVIKPCPIISVDEMLCNIATHFPEMYKQHYAPMHEQLVQASKNCKYASGRACTCGQCTPINFNLN